MVNPLRLEGTDGSLRLEIAQKQCKCYLSTSTIPNQYLGMEGAQYVVSHLLLRLTDPTTEIIGELAGQKVKWILSLAEGTSILYAATLNGDRVLLWQDAKAKLIDTLHVNPVQWAAWRALLEAISL